MSKCKGHGGSCFVAFFTLFLLWFLGEAVDRLADHVDVLTEHVVELEGR